MTRWALAFLLVMVFAASAVWAASPPSLINYQGVLRDASNAPRNGTFDMTFRLFSTPTGGIQILEDSHTGGAGVIVTGGLFSVQIGSGMVIDGPGPGTYTSLAEVFRDYSESYLEVEVGGETLTPRLRVVSVPFALNADSLDGIDSTSLAAAVHVHTGSDITTGTIANARLSTGSGGGLDADSVDGLHASELVPASTNTSLGNKVVRQGANLVWETVSSIRIKPGILGFPDGKVRETTADLVWDFTNGIGDLGLDAGSEASNTWYYLYAVPDQTDDNEFTVIGSANSPPQVGGAGPVGHTSYRFIGSIRNGGSSDIFRFYKLGARTTWAGYQSTGWLYLPNAPLPAVSTWVTVNADSNVPPTAGTVRLSGEYGTSGANRFTFSVRSAGAGHYFCAAGANNEYTICDTTIPIANQQFEWRADPLPEGSGNTAAQYADFNYQGYEEALIDF